MKRYIFIIGLALSTLTLNAQNQVDALRYSQTNPLGTARFTSMGGAYSSLGGDFSSISLNPAGLGVYRSSELTFTPAITFSGANSTFMNNSENDFRYNINMGNIGYVGTILIDDDAMPLKSISFGFGYNNLQNFNEMIEIEGRNTINSLTDHLASRAYGLDSEGFDGYYLFPAWETYLIDPDPSDSKGYVSTYDGFGQLQKMDIQRSGHMGEYVFSMGMNFNHNTYVGASFGVQNVSFEQNIFYQEVDDEDNISNFSEFNYRESLKTDGAGYNFKIGAIFRPIEWYRIGVSIHTPTFYNLYDEYSTNFYSNLDTATYKYPSQLGIYDYKLTSPFKAVGGMSFMILNTAIISLDYEFLDYTISRLRSDNYSFNDENDAIEEAYVPSHNFKVGAEYKLGPMALRGGYSYITSPFANGQLNSGQDIMKYSGGIGFRSKEFFFDMSYVYQNYSEKYLMYEGFGIDAPETDINKTRHSVLATIGFRF